MPSPHLRFYGGAAGALLPIFVFLAGVAWLALGGAPDERGFWPVLVAALGCGLILARDRAAWCEVVLAGMSQRLVALMILAWLLAGILAELLAASGLVDALVAVADRAHLGGGGFVLAAFLASSVLSTAIGTSLGTLILTVPLLYPAGTALGGEPVMLAGALLAGATFGDNISPVSDTTIASASTQGAEMGQVVRTRLRYALPAAAIAALVYGFAGGAAQSSSFYDEALLPALEPSALLMLLVPALIVGLLLLGRHLVEGLLLGTLAAALLGIALGRFGRTELIFLDRDNFIARGLLSAGLERGVGISIFTLLLMGLVATLTATDFADKLFAATEERANSPRSAEGWIAVVTSIVVLLTTHAAVTLLAVGPFARRIGEAQAVVATRRANLLDLVVSIWPFLLPWFIPTILAAGLTAGTSAAPRLGALEIGLHNVHSWALLAILLVAITTGWGRGARQTG